MLVVSSASENDKNVEALSLAKKYDPKGDRTLRILSKFDMFDSKDSQKRAVELVSNNLGLELGPHAVIARTHTENNTQKYCAQQELELFQNILGEQKNSTNLLEKRVGMKYLSARIQSLLEKLITSTRSKIRYFPLNLRFFKIEY